MFLLMVSSLFYLIHIGQLKEERIYLVVVLDFLKNPVIPVVYKIRPTVSTLFEKP